jgi:ABC-2 type transport system ATP-binding protein
MATAVKIQKLEKYFGRVAALRGIDLEIPAGEFFGLLGPNGAGKSTLINCTVGLAKPTKGSVEVFGHDVRKDPVAAKSRIGFSPQEVNVERFFNLRKTLEFQGGFHGLPAVEAKARADRMLTQFGLQDKAHQQFFRLSGGMQKRLLVARALMSQPQLLILDEPTAGVDVAQRHELWNYLRDLNRDGTTIILTTHYIDEAETLCERVGIINHGRVLELGAPKDLIAKYCDSQIILAVEGKITAQDFSDMTGVEVEGQQIRARTKQLGPSTMQLVERVRQHPERRVLDIQVIRGDLEEVFIKVTGRTMEEEAAVQEEKSPVEVVTS